MKRVVTILLLLAYAGPVQLDEPDGWNRLYPIDSHNHLDSVDVVDPTGWNYDRETKTSQRNDGTNKRKDISTLCRSFLESENFDDYALIEHERDLLIKRKIETSVKIGENIVQENVLFMRRFISLLLESADLTNKYTEGEDVSGVVEINLSSKRFNTLLHFSKSIANISFGELDAILSDSIHRKSIVTVDVISMIYQLLFMVGQREVWVFLIYFSVILLCGYRLRKTSQTRKEFLFTLLFFIFCVSFGVEHYRLYKVAEINQRIILEKHPNSCDLNASWWSKFQQLFSSNTDCEKFYKALLLDPFFEISPALVLSSMLSDCILHPFGKIGEAYAAFSSGIFDGLPCLQGWIVWSGASIGGLLLLVILLNRLIGSSLTFSSWFGSVNISEQKSRVQSAVPQPPIETVPELQLGGVAKTNTTMTLDPESFVTLILRAQNSVLHPSRIQELRNSRISEEQMKITESKENNSLKTENKQQSELSECIQSPCEEGERVNNVVSNPRESPVTSSLNTSVHELLGSFEVIQSQESLPEESAIKDKVICEEGRNQF